MNLFCIIWLVLNVITCTLLSLTEQRRYRDMKGALRKLIDRICSYQDASYKCSSVAMETEFVLIHPVSDHSCPTRMSLPPDSDGSLDDPSVYL